MHFWCTILCYCLYYFLINSVDISSLYNHFITNSVFTNRIQPFVSLHLLFYFIFRFIYLYILFFFFSLSLYCVICLLLHVLYYLLYLYVKWVSLYTKLLLKLLKCWYEQIVCVGGLGCYVVETRDVSCHLTCDVCGELSSCTCGDIHACSVD